MTAREHFQRFVANGSTIQALQTIIVNILKEAAIHGVRHWVSDEEVFELLDRADRKYRELVQLAGGKFFDGRGIRPDGLLRFVQKSMGDIFTKWNNARGGQLVV